MRRTAKENNSIRLKHQNGNKKGKQCPYKPGSVPLPLRQWRLSFIYSVCHHTAPAFYPPSDKNIRAGNPQPTVYMNLQPPDDTARRSPGGWWSLTPPSHPYRTEARRLFSSAISCRHRQLLFSEVECPVLPGLSSRTLIGCRRQTGALLSDCKSTSIWRDDKIKAQDYFYSPPKSYVKEHSIVLQPANKRNRTCTQRI